MPKKPLYTSEIMRYLRQSRNDGVPVLVSLYGKKALNGQNTLDHNQAIGRLITYQASTDF